MPTFHHYLSAKSNEDDESEIKFRIYISNQQLIRVSSGIWINRRRWTKSNKISLPLSNGEEREDALVKREVLKTLVRSLDKAIQNYPNKEKIDRSWLEGFITCFHFKFFERQIEIPIDSRDIVHNTLLIPVFEDFIMTQKLSTTDNGHCNTLLRSLKRFQLYNQIQKKRSYKLYLNTLSIDDLNAIKDFLGREKELCMKYPKIYHKVPYYTRTKTSLSARNIKPITISPRERGQNYISVLMALFKRFIEWANEKHNISNDPFETFKIGGLVYGTPVYLTIEERNQLYAADLSAFPEIAVQRDIFIFQCLVGCRIGDLTQLKKDSTSNGVLIYIAHKSKNYNPQTIEAPLNQLAKDILEKHKDCDGEKLLPFTGLHRYNSAIKTAAKLARLDRNVAILDPHTRSFVNKPLYEVMSSHMARRTFIGNLYKKAKNAALVGSLSGHKDGSKSFARYREIDMDMKREILSVLDL